MNTKQIVSEFIEINFFNYDIITDDLNKVYKLYCKGDAPKKYADNISTLDKIEKIIINNFKNETDSKNIKQEESNQILLRISNGICQRYKSETYYIFNTYRYEELDKTLLRIENLINPPFALGQLHTDLSTMILEMFPCKELANLALLNRTAKKIVDKILLYRVQKWAFTGESDTFNACQYIRELFNETQKLCKENILSLKYIDVDVNGKVDPEKTLYKIYLTAEELFCIFNQDAIYDQSYKKFRAFIYKQEKSRPTLVANEAFSLEVRNMGVNAIWKAYVENQEIIVVEMLLKRGLHAWIVGDYLKEKLHLVHVAAVRGDEAALSLFIKNGADKNGVASNGSFPIHFAAQGGHTAIVKQYIDQCDINIQGLAGRTALILACMDNKMDVAALLLQQGADTNIVDTDEKTALYYACCGGYYDLARLLIANKADLEMVYPHSVNPNKMSILTIAAYEGKEDLVKFFLENRINPNMNSKEEKRTPLHFAAGGGHVSIAKLLLESGADINALDKFCNTPLHYAVFNDETAILKLLLENDAKLDIYNINGLRAMNVYIQKSKFSRNKF